MENNNQIAVFEQKQIRRVEHDGEMWLSVVDIIEVLTDSKDPSDYWTTIKRRENQLPTNCRKLIFAPFQSCPIIGWRFAVCQNFDNVND